MDMSDLETTPSIISHSRSLSLHGAARSRPLEHIRLRPRPRPRPRPGLSSLHLAVCLVAQTPRLVAVLAQLLLPHQEHRQQSCPRAANHDLPNQPRRPRERCSHFVPQLVGQAVDLRDHRVGNLDALRKRRREVRGKLLDEHILQDRTSDDDTPALCTSQCVIRIVQQCKGDPWEECAYLGEATDEGEERERVCTV